MSQQFDMSQWLAVCTNNINARVKTRSLSYVLYFSNSGKQPEGKIEGFTIKQLINEFRALGKTYQYAFITKKNDTTVLRFYNSAVSKKFFSMTRKGKKK